MRIILLLLALLPSAYSVSALNPTELRCEYLVDPLGLGETKPRLSWKLAAVDPQSRGLAQVAWHILVATSPEILAEDRGDLWDSGRVPSADTSNVAYAGLPLVSRTECWWKVRVWDQAGGVTAWSAPARWSTGLLQRADWTARWIGAPWQGAGQTSARAPYLRRTFALKGKPARARLYITALGLYEATLNGRRVGDAHFTPGWTDTKKRVQYQVYDVTAHLGEGENVMGVILGDGWYCGHIAQKGRQVYGDQPKLFAQLEITFADGQRQTITSDEAWQVSAGPILENDRLMGESYDARQELPGWLLPGKPAGEWEPVTLFADPGIELSSMLGGPVKAHEEIQARGAPQKFPGWDNNRWVYDFGQNLVGKVTLRIKAPAGTTIKLRYAEMLDAKGELYVDNLRTARATDFYTCKGDPAGETWSPQFTFHGFRYAEISGLPGELTPTRDALVAQVFHTELPPTGDFSCNEPLLNQLQRNIQWGQRGNYFEVPTDCPQRDERLGWTGDAQAFIRTGAWNRDVAAFFTKWQRDIADAQGANGAVPAVIPTIDLAPGDGGPGWADAAIICPWTIYQCYGNRALLERHFDSLRRYVDYLATQSLDDIRLHPQMGKWGGFGDWLALDGSGQIDGGTPKDLIATAFYAQDARLLAAMARALARTAEAAHYEELAERVTKAFQRRFVTADGLVAGNTQTSYVLALHFDLVPIALRPKLADELVRDIKRRGNKLSTGFIGTPYLLHVLSREGHLDVAYALLLQKEWPSWLYAVTQGATTIWERWDGWTKEKGFQDKGMNSFNHYAYGAVGDWLYRVVAGIEIDPQHPGYKHFFLQPQPGGSLTSARGSHQSPHGEIVSSWRRDAGTFEWEVSVPPNTTATACLPVPPTATVSEGAQPLAQSPGVSRVRTDKSGISFELGSGQYHFKASWAN